MSGRMREADRHLVNCGEMNGRFWVRESAGFWGVGQWGSLRQSPRPSCCSALSRRAGVTGEAKLRRRGGLWKQASPGAMVLLHHLHPSQVPAEPHSSYCTRAGSLKLPAGTSPPQVQYMGEFFPNSPPSLFPLFHPYSPSCCQIHLQLLRPHPPQLSSSTRKTSPHSIVKKLFNLSSPTPSSLLSSILLGPSCPWTWAGSFSPT